MQQDTTPLTTVDGYATIEPNELRDLARVMRRAIGILVAYWIAGLRLPPEHPYRQAARVVVSYLEQRYHV